MRCERECKTVCLRVILGGFQVYVRCSSSFLRFFRAFKVDLELVYVLFGVGWLLVGLGLTYVWL